MQKKKKRICTLRLLKKPSVAMTAGKNSWGFHVAVEHIYSAFSQFTYIGGSFEQLV